MIARFRSSARLTVFLASVLALTLTACGGKGSSPAPPPSVSSISVTPTAPSVAAGLTQQMTATGTLSNGSSENLTGSVSWSSGNSAVATVSASGLVTSKTPGTAVITATDGAVSGSDTLTVTAAQLTSVTVSPANPNVAAGLKQQFKATGTYTDGSTSDVTSSATWSSDTPSVATINSSGLATTIIKGTAKITATVGSFTGSTTLNVTAAQVASITVSPANPTVAAGFTQQFKATGTYTDGSTSDITSSATWSSDTPSVATINSSGLATTLVQGTATISAAVGSVTGSATLNVNPPILESIAISPNPATVQIGAATPLQLTATGTYSNQSTQDLTSQVNWSVSNPLVASVNVSGQASPLHTGYTTVTAASGNVSTSTSLTVLATPRYLFVTSDFGRDLTRMAVDSNTGQPRFTGYQSTGDFNNVGTPCLSVDPSGTHAYLTSEVQATGGTGYAGVVFLYSINPATGELTLQPNTANSTSYYSFPIALGCLKFTPNGKFAYAESGIEGAGNQLGTFAVNSDGTLTLENTTSFSFYPTGFSIDPLGQYLYTDVNDVAGGATGTSSLYAYSIDQTTGALTLLNGAPFNLPLGTFGYISFNPSGNFAYIANLVSDTISEYAVNRQTGALSTSATFVITPCSAPMALQFSPDGTHAYATCETSDSPVIAYSVAADGSLTQTGSASAGANPQHLLVGPSGHYLYITNYSSSSSNLLNVYKLGSKGSITLKNQIASRVEANSMAIIGGSSPVQSTTTSAFVASSGDSKITPYTVNSDGTLTPGTVLPTNTGPFSATMLPWGSDLLLATQSAAPNLEAWSVTGNSLSAEAPFGTTSSVGGITIDPNGVSAYASDPSSGQVYRYARTNTWVPLLDSNNKQVYFSAGAGAGPVTMSPSGRYLIVANQTANSISLIQPAGAASTPNVSLSYTPLAMAMDPTGNLLFVAGSDSYLHLLVSDGQGDLAESASAPVPGNMLSVAVDPTADFVYTAGPGGLAAFSYDSTKHTLTPISLNISVPLTNATGVYIDPTGQFLYVSVSSTGNNDLYLFTINSDGTLTASSANPVAAPNDANSMVFQEQLK